MLACDVILGEGLIPYVTVKTAIAEFKPLRGRGGIGIVLPPFSTNMAAPVTLINIKLLLSEFSKFRRTCGTSVLL